MQRYANLSGPSPIRAFGMGPDRILLALEDGSLYLCTHASAGAERIDEMKRLAALGRGLDAYARPSFLDGHATRLR